MKPRKPAAQFTKMFLAILLFCAALALLVNGILTSSIAQSKEEREVEDKIPKHVPIRVKIRAEKEKAFKDLKNANWRRDFELEVTNTSDKPIYFLELWVEYPEVITGTGHRLGVPLRYGRFDFIHFDTLPIPADIPIQPGGTHVFMIPDQDQRGWQAYKVRENRQDPTKVEITFTQLSYGDGSGFNGSDAKPYPYKRDQSSNRPCREGPKEADYTMPSSPAYDCGRTRTTTASLSRVNYTHCLRSTSNRFHSTTKSRSGPTSTAITFAIEPR